ncbi:hypothetical protein CFC21_055178 [Triticum aestivum]|uniref:F-box domain-containing protein n=2 Tax=Triticum aestivum TaxID=4565 RepID=A0A3B6I1R4_WHEAT|nr:uncharacterized protein LOC123088280 [Triticum aestivum]KAF7046128.1 hypothetical protein CFC21_055178 [Triticum aestivum]
MPQLPDELLEEIFLRLPPDEPAALVRASLASKPWLALLTGTAFRGRYREFHGAPPMLGFLYSVFDVSGHEGDPAPLLVSTSKFRARIPDFASTDQDFDLVVWDCRHGRVLLGDADLSSRLLVVWDPMTGCTRQLDGPDDIGKIAVLCAVSGCDHRSCHAGPFKLVCVAVDDSVDGEHVARVCVSSPDMGDSDEWKEQCPGLDVAADAFIYDIPAVLLHDALHFILGYYDDNRVGILKYSLASDSLSLIDVSFAARADILMAMKDGSLGIAHVDSRLTLYVWSRQIDSNGVASWTHGRVVDLKNNIPIKNPKRIPSLIGSVEGSDIIFVNTGHCVYEIDLKTLEWKERMKGRNFHCLIPYMSFYNPPERMIPGDASR